MANVEVGSIREIKCSKFKNPKEVEKVIVYSPSEMMSIGKPTAYAIDRYLDLGNKSLLNDGLYKIKQTFSYHMEKDRREDQKKSWFGKCCALENGWIYDLENNRAMYKEDKDKFEDIDMVEKRDENLLYIAFHHDWSSFDTFNGDNSYYSIKMNGVKLFNNSSFPILVYDKNGDFKFMRVKEYNKEKDGYEYKKFTFEDLNKNYKSKVEEMKKTGEYEKLQKEIAKANLEIFGPRKTVEKDEKAL